MLPFLPIAQVSIAPLCNWKWHPPFCCPFAWCFNRTFMELKVYCTTHARGSPQSFNRTFMELKDGGEPDAPLPYDVSIAPLWNWKSVEPWEGLERGAFQSHLYGIERLLRFSSSAGMTVSIAPLWNWKDGGRSTKAVGVYSFNRTFMELKDR